MAQVLVRIDKIASVGVGCVNWHGALALSATGGVDGQLCSGALLEFARREICGAISNGRPQTE